MDTMETQLRETYSRRDIDELVELRKSNTLTETAYKVLDEIITERGVTTSDVDNILARHAEEEANLRTPNLIKAEKHWEHLRFAAYTLITSYIILFLYVSMVMNSALPISETVINFRDLIMMVVILVLFASFIFLMLSLWLLASSLKQNSIKWLLIMIFIPLGSLIVGAVMYAYLKQARKGIDASYHSRL